MKLRDELTQMGNVFIQSPPKNYFKRQWKPITTETLNFQQSPNFHTIEVVIYSVNNMNKGTVPLSNKKYFEFVRLWCLSNIKKEKWISNTIIFLKCEISSIYFFLANITFSNWNHYYQNYV